MSTALVVEAVVFEGRIKLIDEFAYRTLSARRAKQWGEGTPITIRIEPQDEAWQHGDVKHLFGHVYEPVCEYTGYSKTELHLMAKSLFMPEGKTSLTDLNREELREYTEHVERWLREECADAFVLYEYGAA